MPVNLQKIYSAQYEYSWRVLPISSILHRSKDHTASLLIIAAYGAFASALTSAVNSNTTSTRKMSFVAYNDRQQQEQNSHRQISLEEDSDSASITPSEMLIVPDIATSASTIAYDSDLTDEDEVESVAHKSEIAQYDVLLRSS